MIGISAYAYEFGKNIRSIEEIVGREEAALIASIRDKGLSRVPADNERPLKDMIRKVYEKTGKQPDCVLVAHSLPFLKANADDGFFFAGGVPTYFLSGLPCVIMHKAVELAVQLILGNRYRSVLVIGADKAYADSERVFWETVMADAAIGILLEDGVEEHQILSTHINTCIIAEEGENSPEEKVKEFRQKNASFMRLAMQQCLEDAGISQVDYYAPHTSNRRFWDAVSDLCREPREKFLDSNISRTGHMNSHDSFYHYLYWCERGIIKAGNTVMLINPGFGGSQGCTLIRR